jgi:Ca2+-binding EF-hand superfamily protein
MKTLGFTRVAIGLGLLGSITWSAAALADKNDEAALAEMKAIDTNGDGKLSSEEHAAGAKQTFDAMDSNGDGKVTAAEMEAAQERTSGKETSKAEMRAANKIKVIDRDGDGVLTEVERASAVRTMFEALDTDKDGSISQSEVLAGHAQVKRKADR